MLNLFTHTLACAHSLIHSHIYMHARTCRYVFQINLKWSDDTFSTSYRSYSEFFDYQCDLLIEFPKEAGSQKGHGRTIPYLPGKKIFQKSNKKLALSRLSQIDDYVKALISISGTVMKCDRTCRFFKSNWSEDRLRNGEKSTMVSYAVKSLSKDSLIDFLESKESSDIQC